MSKMVNYDGLIAGHKPGYVIDAGDLPGHKFRGNQYTSGGGSGGGAMKSFKLALREHGIPGQSSVEGEISVSMAHEKQATRLAKKFGMTTPYYNEGRMYFYEK